MDGVQIPILGEVDISSAVLATQSSLRQIISLHKFGKSVKYTPTSLSCDAQAANYALATMPLVGEEKHTFDRLVKQSNLPYRNRKRYNVGMRGFRRFKNASGRMAERYETAWHAGEELLDQILLCLQTPHDRVWERVEEKSDKLDGVLKKLHPKDPYECVVTDFEVHRAGYARSHLVQHIRTDRLTIGYVDCMGVIVDQMITAKDELAKQHPVFEQYYADCLLWYVQRTEELASSRPHPNMFRVLRYATAPNIIAEEVYKNLL